MTRRTFIIKGSTAAGALVGGLTLGRGLLSPPRVLGGKVEFPESRCAPEKKPINKKILVAYANPDDHAIEDAGERRFGRGFPQLEGDPGLGRRPLFA